MSPDAKELSKKLGQKSDWPEWQRGLRQEASRLGLLQNYQNVVDTVMLLEFLPEILLEKKICGRSGAT